MAPVNNSHIILFQYLHQNAIFIIINNKNVRTWQIQKISLSSHYCGNGFHMALCVYAPEYSIILGEPTPLFLLSNPLIAILGARSWVPGFQIFDFNRRSSTVFVRTALPIGLLPSGLVLPERLTIRF